MLSVNERSFRQPGHSNASEGSRERLLSQARRSSLHLGPLLESYRNYLSVLADSRLDRKLRGRLSCSDVVQETMMAAYRDFEQFRGKSEREFLGWLRKILARTLARIVETHVLTQKRDVRRDVSLAKIAAGIEHSTVQLNLGLAAGQKTPSSDARERERAVILADVMSELSSDHREVLILRNIQGLQFAEVAELLGRSTPATKMLWMRAIKSLRERYEGRDEG